MITTKKVWYEYGSIYDTDTGEKLAISHGDCAVFAYRGPAFILFTEQEGKLTMLRCLCVDETKQNKT